MSEITIQPAIPLGPIIDAFVVALGGNILVIVGAIIAFGIVWKGLAALEQGFKNIELNRRDQEALDRHLTRENYKAARRYHRNKKAVHRGKPWRPND